MTFSPAASLPVLCAAALIGSLCGAPAPAQEPTRGPAQGAAGPRAERPNVLFIMVDDLGKDWIGCYGADDVETPHIDALAAGGMKFHNAWSMPQCTPTRVALLTGQYPWRTGWVNHWDVPRWGVGYFDWREYVTFARVMRSAGYAAAAAGKWQINDFRLEPQAMKKHGFDDWCMWTGYEAGNPPSAARYWDPYINSPEGSRTREGAFGPDVYADCLIDFMKANRDEPMCLYFPMALTHGPLVATPDEPDADAGLEKHRAMVRYTDKLVGRLVAALDDLGLRDDTIVFFTTDNGTSGRLRGTIGGVKPSGGKASKYEGGVSMPFIVNGPGRVPAGVETDALTDFTDILPTFAELAGAELPEGAEIDGVSLAPLLLGEADDSPREWILSMGHGPALLDEDGVRGKTPYVGRVLRDKRWKVWVDTDRRIEQLYDMKHDPQERTNLLPLEDDAPAGAAEALAKFRAVVAGLPAVDARPRYAPRPANPWDKRPRARRNRGAAAAR
ncbi:sulfatase-like hydrolase/transferase [Alienimonas sp. DA493]|uniref:sulfatase-like hydrolase/transferase n=1 Tax=Alienimonas sp. DA493 TaxID=3373605 RepID=UPI003754CE6D